MGRGLSPSLGSRDARRGAPLLARPSAMRWRTPRAAITALRVAMVGLGATTANEEDLAECIDDTRKELRHLGAPRGLQEQKTFLTGSHVPQAPSTLTAMPRSTALRSASCTLRRGKLVSRGRMPSDSIVPCATTLTPGTSALFLARANPGHGTGASEVSGGGARDPWDGVAPLRWAGCRGALEELDPGRRMCCHCPRSTLALAWTSVRPPVGRSA